MKASAIRGLATLAAGLLAVLAAPASAQLSTTANGPYYAMPSWDQKLTTNRFVILANWNSEAVLDRESGLVWHKRASSFTGTLNQGNFSSAVRFCRESKTGGRMGWRVPTLQEMLTILDATTGAFADTVFEFSGGYIWTSTGVADFPDQAWLATPGQVSSTYGSTPMIPGPKTFSSASFLCVRSSTAGLPAQ